MKGVREIHARNLAVAGSFLDHHTLHSLNVYDGRATVLDQHIARQRLMGTKRCGTTCREFFS